MSEQHRMLAVAADTLRMTYLVSEHGEPLVGVPGTLFRTRTELSTDDGVTWREVRHAENVRGQPSS